MRIMNMNLCAEAATTVTASSEDSNFPASNLKHPFRSKRWRSLPASSASVVYDFQTTEPVDSVVLLWPKEDGIKLSSSATIKVQANATNVWTSPAVDQILTIDNTYSMASHYFSSDQNYRYWRVLITDGANPYGYIELGLVWIGKSLSVQNAENGFSYTLEDQSEISETKFGHQYVDEYPIKASLQISYSYMEYDEIQILDNMFRINGNKKPVLAVIDPEEAVFNKNHIMIYGMVKKKMSLKHSTYNILNVPDITIEELS